MAVGVAVAVRVDVDVAVAVGVGVGVRVGRGVGVLVGLAVAALTVLVAVGRGVLLPDFVGALHFVGCFECVPFLDLGHTLAGVGLGCFEAASDPANAGAAARIGTSRSTPKVMSRRRFPSSPLVKHTLSTPYHILWRFTRTTHNMCYCGMARTYRDRP